MNIKAVILITLFFFISNSIFSQSKKALNFVDEYVEVAQRNLVKGKVPLLKWSGTDELKYFIYGELKYMTSKGWEKYLNQIESLTQLKIKEANSMSEANIVIYFGDLIDYFNDLQIEGLGYVSPEFSNWNSRKYNADFTLKISSFCIVPDKINKTSYGIYLLQSQMLKSLGLLGESTNKNSLLYKSFTGENRYFKKRDKLLVKLHYNKLITSGLTEDQLKDSILNNIDVDALMKEK